MNFLLAMVTFAALCTVPAIASNFEISPVVLELPSTRAAGVIKITNKGDRDVSLQLRAYDWTQQDNEGELSATQSLIISPPVFTVAPDTTQTIRIISTRSAEGVEVAYRVLVDEIPVMTAAAAVNFRFRISMPVFIAPTAAAEQKLNWVVTGGREPAVLISNIGNRRIRLTKLKLTLPDGNQTTLPTDADPYILAGAVKRYTIDAMPSLAVGSPVNISALSDDGPVDTGIIVTP